MQEALKGLDQKTRPVGLMEIDKTFERVLQESGAGSGGRKLKHLQDLFSSVAKEEKDLLIRLIMGEIRQGALQGLILEAIAEASSVPPERVRQGLMFSGDIGEVARVALEEGSAGLSRFQPRLFHPILPRLANPAAGEEEALARLGEVGWEYKIDGARIQIHKEGAEIAYEDIQESPRYPGGLALRFARVKSYREDKSSLEADTIQKVQAIFESQRK